MSSPERIAVPEEISPVLEHSPILLAMLHSADISPAFKWVSPNIEALLGYKVDECYHEQWWLEHIHPDDRERVEFQFHSALRTKMDRIIQFRFSTRHGDYRHIRSQIHFSNNNGNTEKSVIYQIWTDVTDSQRNSEQLQVLQRAYALLTGSIEAALSHTSADSLYRAVCELAITVGQYQLAWIGLLENDTGRIIPTARAGRDLGYVDQVSATIDYKSPLGCGPTGRTIRNGQVVICDDIMTDSNMGPWRERALERGFRSLIGLPIRIENQVIGAFMMYSDQQYDFNHEERDLLIQLANDLSLGIESMYEKEQRLAAEDRLQQIAFYDDLTTLPRVSYIEELLKNNTDLLNNGGACFLIQLNNFSEYNHILGYDNGDDILRTVAARLREYIGSHQFIAHVAGAKFLILAPECRNSDEASQLASNLLQQIREPVSVHGIPLELNAYIGFDIHNNAVTFERLMRNADMARVHAGENRSAIACYDKSLEIDPSHLKLISELRHAIEHRQLVLRYQPKLDLDTNSISGAEALVRWQHPDKGLIPPGQFIEMAEQTGIITNITLYVIQQALQDIRKISHNNRSLHIAVNVSAADIRNPAFAKYTLDAINYHDVLPEQLTLELTETAIMRDVEQCKQTLHTLNEAGIKIAIDDFGTGYSSLTYLALLPINTIKIDRSFVGQWGHKAWSRSIVKSTIDMARGLSLRSTAEGVEHRQWLDDLKRLGCHEAQGFGIAKPMPLQSFLEWLDAENRVSGF